MESRRVEVDQEIVDSSSSSSKSSINSSSGSSSIKSGSGKGRAGTPGEAKKRDEKEERWLIRYEELKKFVKSHGHCLVPKDYAENPQLGRWVQNQRLQHKLLEQRKSTRLSPFRLAKLNALDFQWRLRDDWFHRYRELAEHYKLHKTCNIPRRYKPNPSLGHFVAKQRFQYKLFKEGKPSSMSVERINLLNSLNFEWNVLEALWMERFRELQEYQQKHGNCLVPESYAANPGLGLWVTNQRAQYRRLIRLDSKSSAASSSTSNKNAMTSHRIRLLNQLDFEFSLSDEKWMVHFADLGHYVKKHGIGVWPTEDLPIRKWLEAQLEINKSSQQNPLRTNGLSQRQRELLALLGFNPQEMQKTQSVERQQHHRINYQEEMDYEHLHFESGEKNTHSICCESDERHNYPCVTDNNSNPTAHYPLYSTVDEELAVDDDDDMEVAAVMVALRQENQSIQMSQTTSTNNNSDAAKIVLMEEHKRNQKRCLSSPKKQSIAIGENCDDQERKHLLQEMFA